MIKELTDDDWDEVFGEGNGGNCSALVPNSHPGYVGSLATFGREDVKQIYGMSNGENDISDWIIWGLLNDDRWFVARAGCDYTGWDCQASNSGDVASSMADIIRFGMSDSERERFGIKL